MNFYQEVYRIVKMIPAGKVATYGDIAKMIGNPRASRAVGYALHVNPYPGTVPCHRVVNRYGRLAPGFAFGGEDIQRSLLADEGVGFDGNGNVLMDKYHWKTVFTADR